MIVQTPNPILTQKAKPVGKIDKKILKVIADLKKTLLSAKNPRGVGLAAPQIGVSLCIFVTRPKSNGSTDVFINPQITWKSKETSEIKREDITSHPKDEKKLEGCLSIDNIWGHLKRPTRVRIKYMDINGNIKEEDFVGFLSTIVQHETDHLDGILFTQRVLEQKEKLYKIEKNDEGKEELVEIKI